MGVEVREHSTTGETRRTNWKWLRRQAQLAWTGECPSGLVSDSLLWLPVEIWIESILPSSRGELREQNVRASRWGTCQQVGYVSGGGTCQQMRSGVRTCVERESRLSLVGWGTKQVMATGRRL